MCLCWGSWGDSGLFLQSEAHLRSRRYVELKPGDLLVHSFDLQHGVEVLEAKVGGGGDPATGASDGVGCLVSVFRSWGRSGLTY